MTLKKRIIPCLDVKNGRVVKGVNFENLIDAGDPVAQAKFYNNEGADELCFLDISASLENRSTLYKIVEEIASNIFIPFSVGGGVREIEDIRQLLLSGADKVSINSAAISNPFLVKQAAEKFGSQCVIVAIDVRYNGSFYEVFSHGGTKGTGINFTNWIQKVAELGAGEILLTSMDRDGTKSGYDLELLKFANSLVNIPIIASGGVGSIQDILDGFNAGADACLAASIFHFRQYSVAEVKSFLKQQSIEVRE